MVLRGSYAQLLRELRYDRKICLARIWLVQDREVPLAKTDATKAVGAIGAGAAVLEVGAPDAVVTLNAVGAIMASFAAFTVDAIRTRCTFFAICAFITIFTISAKHA
jgi:hypothetical protein